MAIPRIPHYALPVAAELPAARVPWRPARPRVALLIHDMQRYFTDAFEPGAQQIACATANISRLRERFREIDAPVIFTSQSGEQDPRDRGLQRDFWGPGMSRRPEQQAIVSELSPLPHESVLTKWRYSAFQRTTLAEMMRARGRDQLVITGVYAHIGCLLTAADAFMHDIQPFFVADAVADFTREEHLQAVNYAAGCCAVPTTTDCLLNEL
ncbi:MAG TPA: isochorismatase family protein [Gemmatimonadales bacterium]|nr:isochorismatase family protein [Gemmatimonadales bacterium]